MPVHNSEIAEMFEEVADLLEIEGANEFRIRAYRNASRVVAGLSKSAADLVNSLSPKG
jgi:DNA polymerase (family 10)